MSKNENWATVPLEVPSLTKKSSLTDHGSSELFRYVPQVQRNSPSLEPSALRLISAVHKINEFTELSHHILSSWPGFDPNLRAPLHQLDPEFTNKNVGGYPVLDEQARMQLAHQASECINHVRTALDYLAFNMTWKDSGSRHEGTKFPLHTKDSGYGRVRKNSVPGLSKKHDAWVESVQPFNGTEWSQALVELSNRDKHRVAIDIVPSFTFTLDRSIPLQDPLGDPSYRGFAVANATVELLLADALEVAPGNSNLEAGHTLRVIVAGAVNLLNLFLVDLGDDSIKIEGLWSDSTSTTGTEPGRREFDA